MIDKTAFQKVYRLNLSTRLLLIIPSVILSGMFLIPLALHWDPEVTLGEVIALLFFMICLPGFGIVYAFSCRLVTTPDGIETYYWFPFHSFIPWNKVERIEQAPFNAVNMVCAPREGKTVNQIIPISTFIDDWQSSELMQDIRGYLPQVKIPDDIQSKKATNFLHRSGTLLIYFAISMTFVLLSLAFLEPIANEQYKIYLNHAGFGLLATSLGGMESMLWFGRWRDEQLDKKKVNELVTLLYLSPISGYLMVFISSMLYYELPMLKEMGRPLINILGFVIGFNQMRILMKLFGQYFGVYPKSVGEK